MLVSPQDLKPQTLDIQPRPKSCPLRRELKILATINNWQKFKFWFISTLHKKILKERTILRRPSYEQNEIRTNESSSIRPCNHSKLSSSVVCRLIVTTKKLVSDRGLHYWPKLAGHPEQTLDTLIVSTSNTDLASLSPPFHSNPTGSDLSSTAKRNNIQLGCPLPPLREGSACTTGNPLLRLLSESKIRSFLS